METELWFPAREDFEKEILARVKTDDPVVLDWVIERSLRTLAQRKVGDNPYTLVSPVKMQELLSRGLINEYGHLTEAGRKYLDGSCQGR